MRALAALIVALVASQATANPLDVYGFGARAMGMANAYTALAADPSASYYNPAGLAMTDRVQIDAGYLLTSPTLRMNGIDQEVDSSSGLMAGILIPGDVGPVRLAFGMAVFLPDARVSRVRALPQFQPRFVMLDNRPQRLFISANAAIMPYPGLSVGGGVTFVTDTHGGVKIDGALYPEAERAVLATAVDVDFRTVRYPEAGVTWAPIPALRIGAVYRGEVKVELDISASISGEIRELLGAKPVSGTFDVTSFNTNLFSPQQVFFGLGWEVTPGTLLALDFGWLDWSAFPSDTATVTIDFALEVIDTAGLVPPSVAPVDPEFSDIFTIRVGAEQTLEALPWLDVALRAGYAFEPTPVPDQPGETNYVDTDKHLFTIGAGLGFLDPLAASAPRPIQVDLGFQYFHYVPRTILKASPADLIGDYTADGHVWSFSAGARFAL